MFLSKVSFIKNGVHFLQDDVIILMLILHISSESFWKVQGISLDLRIRPGQSCAINVGLDSKSNIC